MGTVVGDIGMLLPNSRPPAFLGFPKLECSWTACQSSDKDCPWPTCELVLAKELGMELPFCESEDAENMVKLSSE
jgi:hypothetical protein